MESKESARLDYQRNKVVTLVMGQKAFVKK